MKKEEEKEKGERGKKGRGKERKEKKKPRQQPCVLAWPSCMKITCEIVYNTENAAHISVSLGENHFCT